MSPIERSGRNLQRRRIVERIEIDAPRLEMGAGLIEAFDAASAAEEMIGRAGAEAIADQPVFPTEKAEIAVRDDQVAEARHRADGAVAIADLAHPLQVRLKPTRLAGAAPLDPPALRQVLAHPAPLSPPAPP